MVMPQLNLELRHHAAPTQSLGDVSITILTASGQIQTTDRT